MNKWDDPEAIRRILAECQTWAVVGLGNNPARPAYDVARFLQQHGKRIVPVHPAAEPVLGEPGYASLADIPFAVDCVDVFRRVAAQNAAGLAGSAGRGEQAGAHADEAIAIGAKAVWFQLGVLDPAAFDRADAAGLLMVMNHCPAIEWPNHGPAS